MKRTVLFVLVLIILMQAPGFSQGCAMCRRALESSPEGQGVAASFRSGILLLMGAPYVMLGGAGFAIFRAYRKKKNSTPQQL